MNKGIFFENKVAKLLQKIGFVVKLTEATGDGGIDIIAFKNDDISGGKYIIQCKNWTNPVGEPAIRDLYGVVISENANKGLLITQSTFTARAVEFAKGKHIELVDGSKLNQLFFKYGINEDDSGEPIQDQQFMINELKIKLAESPKNVLLLKKLGDLFLQKGDYQASIHYYCEVAKFKPEMRTNFNVFNRFELNHITALNNHAVCLALSNKYDEALSKYRSIRKEFNETMVGEAILYHCFRLYDLARQKYSLAKFVPARNFDRFLENVHMNVPLEKPSLPMLFLDNDDEMMILNLRIHLPSSEVDFELWRAKLTGNTISQFLIELKGPEDRKKLYIATKELYTDRGMNFDDAKELLTFGGTLDYADQDKAIKAIEKYIALGCTARILS